MNAFRSVATNGITPPKNDKTAIAIAILFPPLKFLNIRNSINSLYYRFKNITISFFIRSKISKY
ncbi:hypothetical protein, partial [Bacillus pseudomycoides]